MSDETVFPAAPRRSRLTAAILTLNEAARLPACLAAVPPGVPIVTVDSGSVDDTVAIARAAGARVLHNPWPGFAKQRNFCLDACRDAADWVLFIDADEIFPPAIFEWIERNVLTRDPGFDAVVFPSLLVLNGRVLRHAPGYPILHHRLVRVGRVAYVERGSSNIETIEAGARLADCPIPYEHYFQDGDLTDWMRRHVAAAAVEAAGGVSGVQGHLTRRARISRLFGNGPWRIPLRFFYHYVWRGGFLDGRAGLLYASMYAWYEAVKWLMRAWERENRASPAPAPKSPAPRPLPNQTPPNQTPPNQMHPTRTPPA